MSYLDSFLRQHAHPAEPTEARLSAAARPGTHPAEPAEGAFVGFVGSGTPRNTSKPLDHGLAVREVLGFPAALLGQLPLPTVLLLDMPSGRRVTVATHPGCGRADHDPAAWAAWCASVPGGTVADVLAAHGATLRMVAIEGGKS